MKGYYNNNNLKSIKNVLPSFVIHLVSRLMSIEVSGMEENDSYSRSQNFGIKIVLILMLT